MKLQPFLFALIGLTILCRCALAQNIDTNIAHFDFVMVPADKVLDVYKKITKADLVALNDIPQQARWVTLHISVPRETVPETVPQLLEQALLKQAHIVLARLDDKEVTVKYDQYDIQLDLQKAEQTAPLLITLTSEDVQTNSVRLITGPEARTQNVCFNFAYKSSEEIEALACGIHRAQILKDGIAVTEPAGYGAILAHDGKRYVGLGLLFTSYDQAKLAEKTLRGE
jgi:hypothetical protein